MNTSIVETVNVIREVAWLPWAVQYFFLIGLSYGAFVVSLPGIVWRRSGWIGISRVALLVALICGLSAPVALLADLHQPGRSYHFYLNFTSSSWMSWGSFFIPVYVGGLMLYAWLAWRPLLAQQALQGDLSPLTARLCRLLGGSESRGALWAAAALTFVGASLVALYTGMEVMVVQAIPLWHTPLLPLLFVVTALAGGIGLTLVLRRLAGQPTADDTVRLARVLALTQALALVIGAVWLLLGLSGLSPIHAQALAQLAPSGAWKVAGLWAAGSTALTLWLALRRPGSGLLIGLLAVHSAWLMRWTILIGGQQVPKSGAGFYPYSLPLGFDGLLGIVGTAGLCIFLFIAITTLLPLERLTAKSA
ncbi:MAG: NrfD/PsrC family molybdoenzyme membrane anchor subunit [Rhodoferax sp.]